MTWNVQPSGYQQTVEMECAVEDDGCGLVFEFEAHTDASGYYETTCPECGMGLFGGIEIGAWP